MSAGFFLSSAGHEVHEPDRFIVVLLAGAALLAASTLTLDIGLLVAYHRHKRGNGPPC